MKSSKFPVVAELEYIEPLCTRAGVGEHDDHLARAGRERALDVCGVLISVDHFSWSIE